jgi:hypothetical protein
MLPAAPTFPMADFLGKFGVGHYKNMAFGVGH